MAKAIVKKQNSGVKDKMFLVLLPGRVLGFENEKCASTSEPIFALPVPDTSQISESDCTVTFSFPYPEADELSLVFNDNSESHDWHQAFYKASTVNPQEIQIIVRLSISLLTFFRSPFAQIQEHTNQ